MGFSGGGDLICCRTLGLRDARTLCFTCSLLVGLTFNRILNIDLVKTKKRNYNGDYR